MNIYKRLNMEIYFRNELLISSQNTSKDIKAIPEDSCLSDTHNGYNNNNNYYYY
jgi:hypothetical protein